MAELCARNGGGLGGGKGRTHYLLIIQLKRPKNPRWSGWYNALNIMSVPVTSPSPVERTFEYRLILEPRRMRRHPPEFSVVALAPGRCRFGSQRFLPQPLLSTMRLGPLGPTTIDGGVTRGMRGLT